MSELGYKTYSLSPIGDMIADHASIKLALGCMQMPEN